MPIELAPLLDRAPKVTPSISLCAAQLDISRTTTGVHHDTDFVFFFNFFIMPSTHSKASKPTSGAAKQPVEQPPAANTRSRTRQAVAKATAKSTDAKAFEAIDLLGRGRLWTIR